MNKLDYSEQFKKLIETIPPTFTDRKVFQYPFLFDLNLNLPDEFSAEDIEYVNKTHQGCDLVLECLHPLSCDVFRKAFQYSSKETESANHSEIFVPIIENRYIRKIHDISVNTIVEYIDPIHEYVPNIPSLDTIMWTTKHEELNELTNEFEKLFKGNYVVAGKSFTNSVLKFGSVSNYYLQYLANGIFGHPNAVMAIQNRRNIVTQFEQLHKRMMTHMIDRKNYEEMANTFFLAITEMSPERWNCDSSSNDIQFQRGDILECMIQIQGHVGTSIQLPTNKQGLEIQHLIQQLFDQSSICDESGNLYPQSWKLRFVLL